MMNLKINNILAQDGSIDYKGLNIEKFIAGTQKYPISHEYCIVKTSGEVPEHNDIIVLTDSEYEAEKELIDNERSNYKSDEEKAIDELKTKLAQAEEDNLTTLEALAEVYEMMLTMQS